MEVVGGQKISLIRCSELRLLGKFSLHSHLQLVVWEPSQCLLVQGEEGLWTVLRLLDPQHLRVATIDIAIADGIYLRPGDMEVCVPICMGLCAIALVPPLGSVTVEKVCMVIWANIAPEFKPQ